MKNASSGRKVYSKSLFNSNSVKKWEKAYQKTIEKKYAKNSRNFNQEIQGKPMKNPPIFLIPRQRAGPSYKEVKLQGVKNKYIYYAPVSKGYSMQDISSFSIGPIVGEGLCLVNAAFSKCIGISHIEGGGKLNLNRKNFWQKARKPERKIEIIDETTMKVNGRKANINKWLTNNEDLWFPEWRKWSRSVALCSRGDFHWVRDNIAFRSSSKKSGKYLSFVEWKKQCYIAPAYNLLPEARSYKFLKKVWKKCSIPLGLVHPKAMKNTAENPITEEFIRNLYDNNEDIACMPYVIAGKLMNIPIYERRESSE